jgi:hypothetical protein
LEQATQPQERHSHRLTQFSPRSRHSRQPVERGTTGWVCRVWWQGRRSGVLAPGLVADDMEGLGLQCL